MPMRSSLVVFFDLHLFGILGIAVCFRVCVIILRFETPGAAVEYFAFFGDLSSTPGAGPPTVSSYRSLRVRLRVIIHRLPSVVRNAVIK